MFARLDFPRFLVCCSGDLSDDESEEKPSVAICGGSICILTGLNDETVTNIISSCYNTPIRSDTDSPFQKHHYINDEMIIKGLLLLSSERKDLKIDPRQ